MGTYRLSIFLVLLSLAATVCAAADLPWSKAEEVPGIVPVHGTIAAAWHDGALHVLAVGRGNDPVQHTMFENGRWVGPTMALNLPYKLAPVMASDGRTLHLLGEVPGKQVGYSAWDGRAWKDPVKIPRMGTSKALEMAVGDGVLHLVHCGENSGAHRIWHSANSGWGWTTNEEIPDRITHLAPGMAVLDGTLHTVHVGNRTKALWHSTRDKWGQWTGNVQIPGVLSGRRPSLVVANDRLYLFFAQGNVRLGEQAPVAYCVFENGRWSEPTAVEGYVAYGKPQVTVQPGVVDQIHLFLPTIKTVLHMQTELEVKMAPVKMQTKTLRR